jgi:hypothetical protein
MILSIFYFKAIAKVLNHQHTCYQPFIHQSIHSFKQVYSSVSNCVLVPSISITPCIDKQCTTSKILEVASPMMDISKSILQQASRTGIITRIEMECIRPIFYHHVTTFIPHMCTPFFIYSTSSHMQTNNKITLSVTTRTTLAPHAFMPSSY